MTIIVQFIVYLGYYILVSIFYIHAALPNIWDILHESVIQITLEGTTNEHTTLDIADLLYIESVGNYVKVVSTHDDEVKTNMLRATMKQMEDALQTYPTIVRCHRAFLVNLSQVEQISSNSHAMQLVMRHGHDTIPVSRSNINKLKELLG